MFGRRKSVQPTCRDLIFIPPEIVAELVQVGNPHFVAECLHVALREFPQVVLVQQDLRWDGAVLRQLSSMRTSGEKAEDIGLKPVREYVGRGGALIMNGHTSRDPSDLRRQLPLSGAHCVSCELGSL